MTSTLERIDNLIQTIENSGNNNMESETKTNESQNQLSGKVVIVGSGLIGMSWAVLFARGGFNVVLFDIKKEQLERAMEFIKNDKIPLLQKYNMTNNRSSKEMINNISTSENLEEALKDAILVQTGVPENLPLKQKVLANIDNVLNKINNKECIISSSASTFSPSSLIKQMKYFMSNTLVSHPVNPPMAIPVVEMVGHPKTDKNVLQKCKLIMEQIGMSVVLMKKEILGSVVNRLQYGLLQAAYQLYEEGVASALDIDKAVKDGLGLRWSFMGPFETIHLNAPKGVNDYCTRYYGSCIEPVMKTLPSTLKWKEQTWNNIHKELDNYIPVDTLPDRCNWRDKRLMDLAKLKNEQNQNDSKNN